VWYAIDNNSYMFRPSGGHHQVFTSVKRKQQYVTVVWGTLVLRSQIVFGISLLAKLKLRQQILNP
jgi:hypothetical protein